MGALLVVLGGVAACQPCGGPDPVPSARPVPSAPALRRELTLVTLNVLATPLRAETRAEALSTLLDASDADVIALQEVAPWFADRLLVADWIRPYEVASREGRPLLAGGQMILSRVPIERAWVEELPGAQRRTVLYADLTLAPGSLRVATSHLESPLDSGEVRARQLEAIVERLSEVDEAVLLGDLNFGDGEEPETRTLGERFTDPWLELHPNEPGYTWDMEVNPLASIGAFVGEGNRRLDRVLLRSRRWRAEAIAIIGDEPLEEVTLSESELRRLRMRDRAPAEDDGEPIRLFGSDHFGLEVSLGRAAAAP